MLGPQGRAGFGDHGCTACRPHPGCPLDPGGSAPRHSHSSNSVYLQHAAVMSNREVMPDCRKGNKIQSLGCEWLFGRRRKEMAAPTPAHSIPPGKGWSNPRLGTPCTPSPSGKGWLRSQRALGMLPPSVGSSSHPTCHHLPQHRTPHTAPALPGPRANTAPSSLKTSAEAR